MVSNVHDEDSGGHHWHVHLGYVHMDICHMSRYVHICGNLNAFMVEQSTLASRLVGRSVDGLIGMPVNILVG